MGLIEKIQITHYFPGLFGGLLLSGEFWLPQPQGEVVKIYFLILPTGLQVHLEDMFWVYKLFAEILSWAEQSGTQFFKKSNLLVVLSSCATISI